VAVLAAIAPTFGAVVYLFPSLTDQDPQFRGSGNAWMDYGNFVIAALAGTIAVLLGWLRSVWLAGIQGARCAGLAGADRGCPRSSWAVSSSATACSLWGYCFGRTQDR
jgi:hypothetical protein